MIDVRVEMVADVVGSGTIHGWHSSRLLKYDGALYFAANKVRSPGAEDNPKWRDRGLIFRRRAGHDGPWEQIANIEPRVYTSCVDSAGRFWTLSPRHFNYITLWRSRAGVDFDRFDRLYDGSCAYVAAGVSREDNFLLLHAEDTCHTAHFPNAVITIFYDRQSDSWHPSRMATPEGRFGYMGIILRGRKAMAIMQSTIFDPTAAPDPPHYSWRHLRVARCEDLTKGQWQQDLWLSRAFGFTMPSDMIVAPDGEIYLAYKHRGGDDSYEATEARPLEFHIARHGMDSGSEVFTPGINPDGSRLFIDSKGQWYLVGRVDEKLQLWRLDPADGFKPTRQWLLPGTEKIVAMLHTLRPERFGGEGDGDTVHLVSSDAKPSVFNTTVKSFGLWHASFDLPVNE